MKKNRSQFDEIRFSQLCEDLYNPLLENERESCQEIISGITSKYASRGFSIPPGAMYADIAKCYKDAIPIRAGIVFENCCNVYRGYVRKPPIEIFLNIILGAIQLELDLILFSGNEAFCNYNAQFKIPLFEAFLEQYQNEISEEGKRQLRHYSSKATTFIGKVAKIKQVENPLDLAPNIFGIGINIKRVIPWFKSIFRK